MRIVLAAGCAALLGACATGSRIPLRSLEQALASEDSASRVLQRRCDARQVGGGAKLSATQLPANTPEPAWLRTVLAVQPGEPLGYRHVALSCAKTTLSFAHNWYVPARLPPEVNRLLTTGPTPFGIAAAGTGFRRERLGSRPGRSAECPSGTVLSQRALLRLPSGAPLALVIECYQGAALASG